MLRSPSRPPAGQALNLAALLLVCLLTPALLLTLCGDALLGQGVSVAWLLRVGISLVAGLLLGDGARWAGAEPLPATAAGLLTAYLLCVVLL